MFLIQISLLVVIQKMCLQSYIGICLGHSFIHQSVQIQFTTRTPYPITTVTPTAGKRGSLLSYVREQKEKYRNCVILTRVREFYESFGIDVILLVEYCCLNPMAEKARAGSPL